MPGRLPRLTRRGEFLRVAGRGRKAARPGLVLQALPQPGEVVRLGFTATRKIGNAVTRNRAKRRLRAAAHLLLAAGRPCGAGAAPPGGSVAAPPSGSSAAPPGGSSAAPPRGWDLVLIARDGTATRTFADLLGDLRGALRQAGVTQPAAVPEPPA